MTERKIRDLLKNHGVKTMRINNKLYAVGYYTLFGQTFSELLLVDPKNKTVGGERILTWLGYC